MANLLSAYRIDKSLRAYGRNERKLSVNNGGLSMDEKKPSPSTNSTPPNPPQPAASQPPSLQPPGKKPLISRRRFLQGAVAASVVLAAASMGASGQILGPLIPESTTTQDIIDWTTLDGQYQAVKSKSTLYQPINYSE